MRFPIKKITLVGIFSSIAIALQVTESILFFNAGVTGGKVGLANVITMISMTVFTPMYTAFIILIRTLVGSLILGNLSMFIYSFCGAMCAFVAMHFSRKIKPFTFIGIGVIGAFFNNLGQVTISSIILKDLSVFSYMGMLGVISVVSGTITGLCAMYLKEKVVLDVK